MEVLFFAEKWRKCSGLTFFVVVKLTLMMYNVSVYANNSSFGRFDIYV